MSGLSGTEAEPVNEMILLPGLQGIGDRFVMVNNDGFTSWSIQPPETLSHDQLSTILAARRQTDPDPPINKPKHDREISSSADSSTRDPDTTAEQVSHDQDQEKQVSDEGHVITAVNSDLPGGGDIHIHGTSIDVSESGDHKAEKVETGQSIGNEIEQEPPVSVPVEDTFPLTDEQA